MISAWMLAACSAGGTELVAVMDRRRSGPPGGGAWVCTVLVAAMVVGFAGKASAVPQSRWLGGEFVSAGAPIYTDAVDGYGCHWFGACRGVTRWPGDPAPAALSERFGRVEVECGLGEYVKVHNRAGGAWRVGWTVVSHVRIGTVRAVERCHMWDF